MIHVLDLLAFGKAHPVIKARLSADDVWLLVRDRSARQFGFKAHKSLFADLISLRDGEEVTLE